MQLELREPSHPAERRGQCTREGRTHEPELTQSREVAELGWNTSRDVCLGDRRTMEEPSEPTKLGGQRATELRAFVHKVRLQAV
eukprot:CAMPEP_0174762140 /NCGR_PEP_ID=MMETSP1094-20130205/109628_1 /TAXON_ID=156173 /ORGANISM="Chrysochromulina brevifilum, Strain UTEX LB 985" /LENGTH=83 /DNA_ID=CAMNT_0015968091 /DNA_START=458 /DNA_END=709 /DNA_ORIENTATION=-